MNRLLLLGGTSVYVKYSLIGKDKKVNISLCNDDQDDQEVDS